MGLTDRAGLIHQDHWNAKSCYINLRIKKAEVVMILISREDKKCCSSLLSRIWIFLQINNSILMTLKTEWANGPACFV